MGSFDLTTTILVKAFEGITGTTDDTLIGTLIERTSKAFDNHTHRLLYTRDYSYLTTVTDKDTADLYENAVLDGLSNPINTRILPLPQRPIISVITVRINELAIDESDSITKSGWFIKSYRFSFKI